MTDLGQTTSSSAMLYRRLLSYTLNYKRYFLLSVIGFALFAGMEALLIQTIEFFVDALEGKVTESLNFLPLELTQSILFVPLAIIVLSIFRGVGSFLGNFYMGRLGLGVVNDLRKQTFSHIVYLPQSHFDKRNSGELVSLIVYNIEQVTGSVTTAVKILLRDGFSLIAFLSLLFIYNWKLTLIFFGVAPILAALIYLASRYFRRVSRKIQKTVGLVTHISTETFQGIKLVKSFAGERYETERFEQAADENLKFGTKFERVNALQTPILHVVIASALALTFFLVLNYWEGSAAAAITYVTAAGLIAKPFRQLSSINSIIQRGLAASETIFEALDLSREKDTGSKTLTNVKGNIEFNNICFGYTEEQRALDNVSFSVKPGETVALVGSSGSGKTTLASLLLRFYEAESGSITIDNTPINELSLKSLRANIALVNQQTILFNDSISANIAYGSDLTKVEQSKLLYAAEHAYAKPFIDNLDEQFDTLVGEDGARLSGGQRQRIAIARALFKDAPILILDEATSALDNESEKKIQLALDELKANRTTFVIAHRLSTIESADKIIVLDAGKVVEQGTHATLMEKSGYYSTLYQTQFAQSE